MPTKALSVSASFTAVVPVPMDPGLMVALNSRVIVPSAMYSLRLTKGVAGVAGIDQIGRLGPPR